MVRTYRGFDGKVHHDDFSYLSREGTETPRQKDEREQNRARIDREYTAQHMRQEANDVERGRPVSGSYGRAWRDRY